MTGSCPKCGAEQGAEGTACKKCGLAVDRMESFARDRDAAAPDVLIAAWDRAIEGWDEPARHDEVLRLVAQHDAYAWAAARYRTRSGDPIGDRQLERVRKAAEVTMMSSAAARKVTDKTPYRATVGLLVLLVVVAVAGLVYAMVMADRASDTPAENG